MTDTTTGTGAGPVPARKKSSKKPGAKKASGAKKPAKKAAASAKAKKPAKKAAAGNGVTKKRWNLTDEKKIKVVGENTRRPDSRFGKNYKLMEKNDGKTVGNFIKGGGERAVLREAVKEGFVKVA